MGVRKLVDVNHEALKYKAKEVKKVTDPIRKLMTDMVETMKHHNGLGLAAPQIGISKQIIVVHREDDDPLTLVNPVLTESSGEIVDVEGCLSVPGIYGEVARAAKTVVEALNEKNETVIVESEGLLARIFQHEIDHLEGTLFTEKVKRFLDAEDFEEEADN